MSASGSTIRRLPASKRSEPPEATEPPRGTRTVSPAWWTSSRRPPLASSLLDPGTYSSTSSLTSRCFKSSSRNLPGVEPVIVPRIVATSPSTAKVAGSSEAAASSANSTSSSLRSPDPSKIRQQSRSKSSLSSAASRKRSPFPSSSANQAAACSCRSSSVVLGSETMAASAALMRPSSSVSTSTKDHAPTRGLSPNSSGERYLSPLASASAICARPSQTG